MKLHNDLWDYALQLYAKPGVESACLQLQQQWSLGVNRLLFCCWLATEGRALQAQQLVSCEASQWQQSTTEPLRLLRYQVRAQRQHEPGLERCYQALRQAELAAEQVELAWLFTLGRDWPVVAAVSCEDLLLQNISQYLGSEAIAPEPGLLAALQVLVQATAGPAPARRLLHLQW